MIKVFLDAVPPTPSGWVHAYWPEEVIALIEKGGVEVISLDHDLGDDDRGTGYDVCKWLEEKVWSNGFDGNFVIPVILLHTANPVARKRMEDSIQWIYHNFKVFQPVAWDAFRERLAFYR